MNSMNSMFYCNGKIKDKIEEQDNHKYKSICWTNYYLSYKTKTIIQIHCII